MIFSDLTNPTFTKNLPAPLADILLRVCEKLAAQPVADLTLGKHDITQDAFIVVAEPTIAPADSKQFEIHRKYIDIHIMLDGEEWIDYAVQNANLADYDPYHEDDDYQITHNQLPASVNVGRVKLNPQNFAVFFPYEAHKPCCTETNTCAPKTVKKVVVKVPMYLLNNDPLAVLA